jgi:peptide/nickel transport system substrate-binding protein
VLDSYAPRRRRWVAGFAVVAAMALVASACSSDDDGNTAGSGTNATTPADEGQAKPGGSVVYGLEAETLGGWCPQSAQLAAGGIQVASAIYDTLTAPNEKGDYVPYLAKSIEPNADYTEWTIGLRSGIKFHNGEDLNAEIVKKNLDGYLTGVLFGLVLADVNEITVADPMTVKITTRVPWVAFPAFLWSTGRLGIAAAEQIDAGEDCKRKLIGTGPFKLVEWTPNDKLVAEKNPTYWQKDENGVQLPYLDQITFRPQENTSQLVSGLKGGQYDLVHLTDGKEISRLRNDSQVKQLESTRSAEIGHVMLNTSKPPFNNLNARLALAYATDADELNRVHEGGIHKLAKQPYAPETLGYQEDPGWPEFNLQKAKDAAAKYKQETGQDLRFELDTTPDPATQALAASHKAQWEEAGIIANIVAPTEQSQYINVGIGGSYEAILWRNFPGGDPDTLYVWWHSKAWNDETQAFDKVNLTNFGRINDPEIDAALEAGRSETDKAKREQHYQNIGKEFAKDAYKIWTWYSTWAFAGKTDVNGVVAPKLPGDGDAPVTTNGDERGLPIASVQPVLGLWRG